MLWGDAREEWNGTTMPDPRVTHFWDGNTQIGQWFAKNVDGFDGTSWDAYYLYGPAATWNSIPAPLLGTGGPIYAEQGQLETQLQTLLKN